MYFDLQVIQKLVEIKVFKIHINLEDSNHMQTKL